MRLSSPSTSGSGPSGAPLRFIIAGGFNTIAMLVLYVSLLHLFPHAVAYSITFAVGVVLSYLLNRLFVFRSKGGVSTVLLFPVVYVFQYLVGLLVVVVWVDLLGLPAALASLAAVVVTLPITYALLRWVFVARQSRPQEAELSSEAANGRTAGMPASEGSASPDDR